MKIRFLIFAVLLLPLSYVSANDLALIQPKGSSLKETQLDKKQLIAQFSGNVWVSGSLVMEQSESVADAEPEYILVLDRKSVARLPYFDGYKVEWIGVENGKEAFERAGGPTIAISGRDDAKDGIRFQKITGTFEITDYVVGVECDSPWARARIVNSKIPDQRQVVSLGSPGGC